MEGDCLEVTQSRQVHEGTIADIRLILWPLLPEVGGRKKDAFPKNLSIVIMRNQKW